ncbi:MAG: beta-ketoacyl-[acyl-carrier-protein] synthase II [Proteobacteria bacterium]|nr:MAG: beta-ketoacyl-[acyl-carrier-protein] synthase II [Pseudomonadota bacterium]
MGKRRVAITGIGALTPLGNSRAATWEAAKAGRSGVGKITRFDCAAFPTQIAAEVKNFDPTAFLEHKEIKKHDLFSQYAIAVSQEAWDDAGLGAAKYSPSKMGCILGIGIGGLGTMEKYHQALLEGGPKKISPFLVPAMISNLGPGNVAMRFGLKGVNFTVTSACTSATHALGEAYRMISNGIQDVVISGGAEAAVTPIGVGGFCAMKALSTRNEEPERASRPFDKDRDGFVLGEGAAAFVLEPYEEALKRGAKIYCELTGYGVSCDAYHITAPSPDGEGAVSCMQAALKDAGLSPEQISYVNAHGTSTPANDISETAAIKKVFGSWAKGGLLVSSTKSMTGHLLGAAGAIEAAFSALAILDGIVPPTINLDNPEEGCDLDYVPHTARQTQASAVMSNSFGFGGTNASIILRAVK